MSGPNRRRSPGRPRRCWFRPAPRDHLRAASQSGASMSRVHRLLLALALVAGPAAAQSSEFGVRGLGIPLRPISVRAGGTGGAFGLFDAESGLNPASIALVGYVTASFQTVQAWRRSETPAGSASVQDNRFPGI